MRCLRLPVSFLLTLNTIYFLLAKTSTTPTSSAWTPIPPIVKSPSATLTTTIQPAILPRRYHQHYAHLPLGWNLYYTTWTQILPSSALIQHLDIVYSFIGYNAVQLWSHNPQKSHLVINVGFLQMEFLSETRTIPWEFVAAFVGEARAQLIRNGFCAFYAVLLSHAASEHVVQVALRLNPILTRGTRGS